MSGMDDWLGRLLELVKSDPELKAATLRCMDGWASMQTAKAEMLLRKARKGGGI